MTEPMLRWSHILNRWLHHFWSLEWTVVHYWVPTVFVHAYAYTDIFYTDGPGRVGLGILVGWFLMVMFIAHEKSFEYIEDSPSAKDGDGS